MDICSIEGCVQRATFASAYGRAWGLCSAHTSGWDANTMTVPEYVMYKSRAQVCVWPSWRWR